MGIESHVAIVKSSSIKGRLFPKTFLELYYKVIESEKSDGTKVPIIEARYIKGRHYPPEGEVLRLVSSNKDPYKILRYDTLNPGNGEIIDSTYEENLVKRFCDAIKDFMRNDFYISQ